MSYEVESIKYTLKKIDLFDKVIKLDKQLAATNQVTKDAEQKCRAAF